MIITDLYKNSKYQEGFYQILLKIFKISKIKYMIN